jgi:hypothetical protein
MATLQTGFPEEQSTVFFTHGVWGSEQSVPALQVVHTPPAQTESVPVPHCVPSGSGVDVGAHVRTVPEQT